MNIEVKNSVKPVDYNKSMDILERRVENILLGKKNELLWILEHNTVYTAGTSSNEKDLINKNIKIIKTNRGGKYTIHSPGQKIIYFVIILLISSHCSIDNKSGFWKDKQNPNNEIKLTDIDFSKKLTFEQFKENVVLFGKNSKFPNLIE